MIIACIVMYLLLAFVFYGYCFSYWEDNYTVKEHTLNTIASIFFSLLFPIFLLPFLLSKAWKYGWRLK